MSEPSTCAISASADACASRSTRTETELRALMARAVHEVRETNPLAPSITNTVTQNFVANAQLAVGGCTPSPRKLSAASSSIAEPALAVNCVTRRGAILGSTWRHTSATPVQP